MPISFSLLQEIRFIAQTAILHPVCRLGAIDEVSSSERLSVKSAGFLPTSFLAPPDRIELEGLVLAERMGSMGRPGPYGGAWPDRHRPTTGVGGRCEHERLAPPDVGPGATGRPLIYTSTHAVCCLSRSDVRPISFAAPHRAPAFRSDRLPRQRAHWFASSAPASVSRDELVDFRNSAFCSSNPHSSTTTAIPRGKTSFGI